MLQPEKSSSIFLELRAHSWPRPSQHHPRAPPSPGTGVRSLTAHLLHPSPRALSHIFPAAHLNCVYTSQQDSYHSTCSFRTQLWLDNDIQLRHKEANWRFIFPPRCSEAVSPSPAAGGREFMTCQDWNLVFPTALFNKRSYPQGVKLFKKQNKNLVFSCKEADIETCGALPSYLVHI